MAASAHRVCQTPLKSGSVTGHRRAEEGDQSPTAGGQTRTLSVPMASHRTKQARNEVSRSTGRFRMAPLRSPLVCPPAESLRDSRANDSAFRAKSGAREDWYAGTWNVRSLLDNEGSIETARQGSERDGNEDRRIDLVLRELGRYGIKVAALQETKWFGNAVYHVGRSVVLSAGRPTPGTEQPRQRGEGVAIVLTGEAVTAWNAGGEQWKARSSRLITAKLKHGDRHQDILHVISCYAPTFAVNRTEKDKFFNDLQQALDEIPPEEPYLLLGDFNARVGSRSEADEEWEHTRGPNGFAEVNEAGKELLTFLSLNEATVCNTWFSKRDIYKQTWQHPKSKRWHCIDFAIVRQRDRRRCLDAAVKRGAECHTDHQLLRIKLRMTRVWKHQTPQRGGSKRYNVSKLCSSESDRKMFQEEVNSRASKAWKENGTVTEQWSAIRASLTEAAETVLGTEHRRYPDWFSENSQNLEPLFRSRNQHYSKWLGTGKEQDRQRFVKARSDARRAVREAKNSWFQEKAEEAQRGRFGSKKVWQCIRDMQRGRRGMIPVRRATIKDEEGHLCTTTQEQQERWRRHFSTVLNIQSHHNATEMEKTRQRPTRHQMAKLPSREELTDAVGKLQNGKAAGKSGILPEMVKAGCCNDNFLNIMLDLVCKVWQEKEVPKEWADAVLVPIPKKGDLGQCDNWRGVALLDVVGKVVAKVLQDRLQQLAEEELPESQCGFRRGRGCSDMIYTVRQLVEKSWEHQSKAFLLFIDLKKAYDSVPREAMWAALGKLGVPEPVIELIRSFHQDMQAQIQLNGTVLEAINVTNGLRQGCCMAPVLFNLYASLVVERWTARIAKLGGVGVYLRYKHDGKLFRRYTKNAKEAWLTECQFADDAALLATTREGTERAMEEYLRVAEDFGLSVSIPKTKLMVTGRQVTEADRAPLHVNNTVIESVTEFPYLGSLVASSGRVDTEVEKRIAQASRAFGALRKPVFSDSTLYVATKRKVYQACVLSILLYGSECWTPLQRQLKNLDSFHHRCIQTILGITNSQQWEEHITALETRQRWGGP